VQITSKSCSGLEQQILLAGFGVVKRFVHVSTPSYAVPTTELIVMVALEPVSK
jgi:hypothetical protein